jgi:hypothetical protein
VGKAVQFRIGDGHAIHRTRKMPKAGAEHEPQLHRRIARAAPDQINAL